MAVEFRCQDAGVACRKTTRAGDVDELLVKVEDHAREAHDVELTATLRDYAASAARPTER